MGHPRRVFIEQGTARLEHHDGASSRWVAGASDVPFSIDLLGCDVSIEDTTLGQFWAWLVADRSVAHALESIFAEELCLRSIQPYITRSKTALDESGEDRGVTYETLEFYWHANLSGGQVNVYVGLHAWGREIGGDGASLPYAIEYSPMHVFNPYPLVLNTTFAMNAEHPGTPVASGTRAFTLYDILGALLDYSNPTLRD